MVEINGSFSRFKILNLIFFRLVFLILLLEKLANSYFISCFWNMI